MRAGFGIIAVFALLPLAGCGDFPELNVVTPDQSNADFPKLVPIEPLLAAAQTVQITPESQTALDARIARLRARAARLKRRTIQ